MNNIGNKAKVGVLALLSVAPFSTPFLQNKPTVSESNAIYVSDDENSKLIDTPQSSVFFKKKYEEGIKSQTDYLVSKKDTVNYIVKNLIENNQNTFEILNINNIKFSREDLGNIKECDLSNSIINYALDHAKRGRPQPGVINHCLGAVKDYLNKNGIELQAYNFAYRAVEALRKNDKFVEVECEIKDLNYLPSGSVVVWERGTTPYGHIGLFKKDESGGIGKDVSDWVRNQRTSRFGRSDGKYYGSQRVFMLKENILEPVLFSKLIEKLPEKEFNRLYELAKELEFSNILNDISNENQFDSGQDLDSQTGVKSTKNIITKNKASDNKNLIAMNKYLSSKSR